MRAGLAGRPRAKSKPYTSHATCLEESVVSQFENTKNETVAT